uniref:Secreted protein n=1 Tax=Anopheles merus TaxID=30066 RepID=A0A182USA5_ANOME
MVTTLSWCSCCFSAIVDVVDANSFGEIRFGSSGLARSSCQASRNHFFFGLNVDCFDGTQHSSPDSFSSWLVGSCHWINFGSEFFALVVTGLVRPMQAFISISPLRIDFVLFGQRLYNKIIAPFQRLERMIRTVAIGVRKSHLAVSDGADERTFAGMKPLILNAERRK